MKLFILGLLVLSIVSFLAYKKKIYENFDGNEEKSYQDTQEQRFNIMNKYPVDNSLVPQGEGTSFIGIENDLSTSDNYMKKRDAVFKEKPIQQTVPKSTLSTNINSCNMISKCSELNNSDCGYCLYSNEFSYGGTAGPGTDVCPANAWTNDPNKCQEMKEKALCKTVKSCADLTGESGDVCGWCPTSGRAMPMKKVGDKYLPKYPDDVCSDMDAGLIKSGDCAKFFRNHPCLTPQINSGPLSAACLASLWKKAIGPDRRKIDWNAYIKNKNAFWNTRGMNAVYNDMKAWLAYTKSSDYKTAVKGYAMCFGTKPDPCSSQFSPRPTECMDQLWEKGGGQPDGSGLPSKAGFFRQGESSYKQTIGGYQYTFDEAKSVCAENGGRLCYKNEIMDKNICSAGWVADKIRGYPMATGVEWYDKRANNPALAYSKSYCGGRSNGWRTWSTDPNNKGSAHCCYEFNASNSQEDIINITKKLANEATGGDTGDKAGLMKMVFGKNWTPPPPAKVGDYCKFEGSNNQILWGYVMEKLGEECAMMWTNVKTPKYAQERAKLPKNDEGMNSQRYWFGWPKVPPQNNYGPDIQSNGLVRTDNLLVLKPCSNAPSNCGANCQSIIRNLLETYPQPQDCVVSGWGEWSGCNKTCGPGQKTRTRTVLKQAQRDGAACPALTETADCENRPCYPSNYKGCYKDCDGQRKGGSVRDLPLSGYGVTKEQCAEQAVNRNKKYYGLQYQNGVGGGDRMVAQCWLGDSYGAQGTNSNCKDLGSQGNIPFGQSCTNAVYENENYKPVNYTDEGNKYCVGYTSYKTSVQNNAENCKMSCDEDPNCNAAAFSKINRGGGHNCTTYHNCTITDDTQNWDYNYYYKPGVSVTWGGESWMQNCNQYTKNVGPYKSSGGQYLADACQVGYDSGSCSRYDGDTSVADWKRTACATGERLKSLDAYTLPQLRENSAPPTGYKAKPGSGPCECRGSGYGRDSCGTLCCDASPYTSTIPGNKYYYKNGGNRTTDNLCYEKI